MKNSAESFLLERRRVLQAAIGVVAFVWSRGAWAQQADLSRFAATLERIEPRAKRLLESIRAEASKFPLPIDRQVDFAVADYSQRLRLAAAARGLTNDDLRKIVRDDMTPWADQFVEYKIRLVPLTAEVYPIPVVNVQEQSTSEAKKSDRLDVIVDILLDALALLEAKETIKEIIRKLPGFEERVENISKAMKSGRPDAIVDGLFELGKHVFEAKVAKTILEALGEKQKRRLLAALGARFIPFVGWTYFFVAVALSTTRHWERLQAT